LIVPRCQCFLRGQRISINKIHYPEPNMHQSIEIEK
jgi:hypothetical protein